MAHTEEMLINGVMAGVTVFDQSAQDIDDAAAMAKFGHQNLLDNWYFADPIDQRGGYVVPPGVGYYIPNSWEQAGTTSGYVKVIRFWSDGTQNYPIISVDGTDYVLNPGDAVRGYTGAGYTIDRWKSGSGETVTLMDGYARVTCTQSSGRTFDHIVDQNLDGKAVTVSCLVSATNGTSPQIVLVNGSGSTLRSQRIFDIGVTSLVVTIPEGSGNIAVRVCPTNVGDSVDIIAAKLELGDQQTLAHQDADGNWVLNEIPNYAEELAKCQRYYIEMNNLGNKYPQVALLVGESETLASGFVELPVTMRYRPAVTYSGAWRLYGIVDGSVHLVSNIELNNAVNGVTSKPFVSVTTTGLTKGALYYLSGNGGNPVPKLAFDANL